MPKSPEKQERLRKLRNGGRWFVSSSFPFWSFKLRINRDKGEFFELTSLGFIPNGGMKN
jgi:hypothetical protein